MKTTLVHTVTPTKGLLAEGALVGADVGAEVGAEVGDPGWLVGGGVLDEDGGAAVPGLKFHALDEDEEKPYI